MSIPSDFVAAAEAIAEAKIKKDLQLQKLKAEFFVNKKKEFERECRMAIDDGKSEFQVFFDPFKAEVEISPGELAEFFNQEFNTYGWYSYSPPGNPSRWTPYNIDVQLGERPSKPTLNLKSEEEDLEAIPPLIAILIVVSVLAIISAIVYGLMGT
jgi:hypothetical protein